MFKSMRYIELEYSEKEYIPKIEKIIEEKRDMGYGKCFKLCEEPIKTLYPVDKAVIFKVYVENDVDELKLISLIDKEVSNLLNHKIHVADLCPGPVIRIKFKDCDGVDKNSIKEIFSKKRENGVGEIVNSEDLPSLVHSFAFQIKCQPHYFEVLHNEFLDEINQLECEYDICYYRHL